MCSEHIMKTMRESSLTESISVSKRNSMHVSTFATLLDRAKKSMESGDPTRDIDSKSDDGGWF